MPINERFPSPVAERLYRKEYAFLIWQSATELVEDAVRQESWRVPAGESPAWVRGSARPVANVASWKGSPHGAPGEAGAIQRVQVPSG